MKIRVQRQDGLWEVIELPSDETKVLDLESDTNCVFAGPLVNHYFTQDGYYAGPGRSMEAMTGTHSEASATEQAKELESSRQFQDALDSDTLV